MGDLSRPLLTRLIAPLSHSVDPAVSYPPGWFNAEGKIELDKAPLHVRILLLPGNSNGC